ncbi:phage tail tape measure protein [Cyclobacterium lianum]|nr:phage tail tape measure protein [Cyclobacterium lianum]
MSILGGIATHTTAQFSDGMLRVQALTNATTSEFKALNDQAKELGGNTRFSATEVSEAMQYMALAGYNTKQIQDSLASSLDLAAVAGGNLATTTDILTDVMSAYQIEANQTSKVSDLFAIGQAKANTSVEQLGEAMKYSSSNMASANQTIEDSISLLAVFANSGLKGSMAGTTLNAVMRDMKKASDNGNVAIGGMNVSLYDTEGNMRSLVDIIQDVETATTGMTGKMRDSALAGIFKQESIRGVNLLLNSGSEELRRYQRELANSEGSAHSMAETMESGLGGALRSMRSALESIQIEIGEKLAPMFYSLADGVKAVANWFRNLDDSTKEIVVGFGVFLAIVPPLILGLGQIVRLVSSSIGALKVLSPLLAGISTPVLAIGLAVGATVLLIYKYWDEIVDYFTNGNGVTFLDSLKKLWNTTINGIKDIINEFVSVSKRVWDKYGKEITEVFNFLKSTVFTAFDLIISNLTLVIDYLRTFVDVAVKLVKGDFKGAFESVGNFIQSFFKVIFKNILTVFSTVISGISKVTGYFGLDNISSGLKTVNGYLDEYIAKVKQVKKESESVAPLTVLEPKTIQPLPISQVNNNGTNRAISTAISGVTVVEPEIKLTNFNQKLKEIELAGRSLSQSFQQIGLDLSNGFNYIINEGIAEGLSSFSTALGEVLSGSAHISSIGTVLLESLTNVMQQLGKMAIGAGIAILGIKKALQSLNPDVAIAGGVALIALAGFIKSSMGNMATNNFGGSRAEGGAVNMGSAYKVGERGTELFVPNQSGTIISSNDLKFRNNQPTELRGKFRIEGSDLVYIVNKENQKRGRV